MKLSFKRNVGPVDRVLRGILGLSLVGLAYFNVIPLSPTVTWLLYIAGIFMLIEAATAY